MHHLPASIVPILLAFMSLFTAPTWRHVQVLGSVRTTITCMAGLARM
jgi:hypothetical protein